jgi:hypothetical protein
MRTKLTDTQLDMVLLHVRNQREYYESMLPNSRVGKNKLTGDIDTQMLIGAINALLTFESHLRANLDFNLNE